MRHVSRPCGAQSALQRHRRLFCRDRTTAAYACALVEERRDDPAVDRVLDTLEGLCGDLARGIRSRPQVRP
jgi:hypothetical protein